MKELGNLFNALRAKEINFSQFIKELGVWFDDIGVGEKYTAIVESTWFPYVALAVGALFIFYGKRWLGLLKFASCGLAGFIVGLVLNPLLVDMLPFLVGRAVCSDTCSSQ